MTEIKINHLGGVMVEGAIIVEWLKHDGEVVKKGEKIAIVETRKITADITAVSSGILQHCFAAGDRVELEAVIGLIK